MDFVHSYCYFFKVKSPRPRFRRALSKTSFTVLFDRDEDIKTWQCMWVDQYEIWVDQYKMWVDQYKMLVDQYKMWVDQHKMSKSNFYNILI